VQITAVAANIAIRPVTRISCPSSGATRVVTV
jgi:hypothetical protein